VGTYSFYLLCGPPDERVVLDLRDGAGAVRPVTLPRSYHQILSFRQPVEFTLLAGNIGLVALNTFGPREAVAAFDSLFPEIVTTDALILDLRRNTGGNGDVGYNILGYLTDRPFRTTMGRSREYDSFSRATGRKQPWKVIPSTDWQPSKEKHYLKPVSVLIGPQTGSAAEDFCAAFAAMKRGVLVGEPTAGTTGQPLVYGLPGGGSGIVCTMHVLAPDGSEFVGVGIQPQIAAPTRIEDLRRGRDAVLEAAVGELERRLSR
jgi:C-terminal processing protease CtpA/Prc